LSKKDPLFVGIFSFFEKSEIFKGLLETKEKA